VLYAPQGAIRGRAIGIPRDSLTGEIWIQVSDTTRHIRAWQRLADDSTYCIAVPNGTYTVQISYCYPHSCVGHEASGIQVNNDTAVVNFTSSGPDLVIGHVTASGARPPSLQAIAGRTPIAVLYTPKAVRARVVLYDLAGRCVAVLLSGRVQPGTLRLPLAGQNGRLPAGTFVLRATLIGERTVVLQQAVVNAR
jgi:hypothetical protein